MGLKDSEKTTWFGLAWLVAWLRAIEKMHGLEKLIKSACNCLLSVSQALELEIHALNEFTFSNQDQTAVLSFGYSSVVSSTRDTFWFGMLCVAKRFQFRFLAGRPAITKPIWQSPVTRMAIPLFGWVCEAYLCPANSIFPQPALPCLGLAWPGLAWHDMACSSRLDCPHVSVLTPS